MTESRDPIDEGFERLRRRREPGREGATPPEFVERIVDGTLDEGELPAAARAWLYDREARDRALDLLAADLALEREAIPASGGTSGDEPGDARAPSFRGAWPWVAGLAAAAVVLIALRTWIVPPPGGESSLDLGGYLVAVVGEPAPQKGANGDSPLRAVLRLRKDERLRLVAPEGGGERAAAKAGLVAVALWLDHPGAASSRTLDVDATVAIAELAPSGQGFYAIAIGTRPARRLENALRVAAAGPQETLARGEGLAAAQAALERALDSERGATDAFYLLVEVVP